MTRIAWRQIDGYAGLPPRSALLGDGASRNGLRIAGVQWVWAENLPLESDEWRELTDRVSDDGWCEISDFLPRVRFVAEIRTSQSPRHDVKDIDPATVGIVDRMPLEDLAPDPKATAKTRFDVPGQIEIETRSATSQLLVVNERFHRGWSVRIDGIETNNFVAYGDFQACVVPAGEHRVSWVFRPSSLRWGRCLSLVGLLATTVLSIIGVLVRRVKFGARVNFGALTKFGATVKT